MEKEFKYPSTAELMVLIAKSQFRPFTEGDWYAFAGCESENPLISEADHYCIVIDGNTVNVLYYGDEYGGALYSLNEGL